MATFRENKTTFNSIFISYVKLIDDGSFKGALSEYCRAIFLGFNLKKNTNYIY